MANFTTKWLRGTIATIFSTELNSMANNAQVITSSPFDNSANLDLMAQAEIVIAGMGGTPTANTGLSVWFLVNVDGTNYEDGSTSVAPMRFADVVMPIRAVSTAQRIIIPCIVPAGSFHVLIRNDGTGQALNSSGNTLKIRPLTYQAVKQ